VHCIISNFFDTLWFQRQLLKQLAEHDKVQMFTNI